MDITTLLGDIDSYSKTPEGVAKREASDVKFAIKESPPRPTGAERAAERREIAAECHETLTQFFGGKEEYRAAREEIKMELMLKLQDTITEFYHTGMKKWRPYPTGVFCGLRGNGDFKRFMRADMLEAVRTLGDGAIDLVFPLPEDF